MRTALALFAALASGAAGLALELIAIELAGLLLGAGLASGLGIGLFVAGWALGARLSAAPRRSSLLALCAGGLSILLSFAVPALWLRLAAAPPAGAASTALAAVGLFVLAIPGGLVFPLLARALPPCTGPPALFAASFAGGAVGAFVIADRLAALRGLPEAAIGAGVTALFAGALAALAVRNGREPGAAHSGVSERRPPLVRAPGRWAPGPIAAGALLALGTGWLIVLEWVGVRVGVLWIGGMHASLQAVLLASLLALAAGALGLAPPLSRRGGIGALLPLLALAWPLLVLSSVTLAGSERARLPLVAALLGPALLGFGALPAVLLAGLAGARGPALARLLLWEALGALAVAPVALLAVVPRLGIDRTLGALALAAAVLLAAVSRGRALAPALLSALAGLLPFLLPVRLARLSPPLTDPALTVLDEGEDQHFAVAVVADGLEGERTLLTDGFRAAGTGPTYRYMRALGHLPVLLAPSPRRVAVLAFGTGTTAGAVSLHPEVERLQILELSRAVCERAEWFEEVNRSILADGIGAALEGRAAGGRVRLVLGDGRRALADSPGSFDVITMEPLLPDTPFAVHLYTVEFYRVARRALTPRGLLCQWVPPHALPPESFEAVLAAFADAFPWSGLFLFGDQLCLLGGEVAPSLDPTRFPGSTAALAEDLEGLGIATPGGLLARWITTGERIPAAVRPLRDGDPWILFRAEDRIPFAQGARNLAWLRELAAPPPDAWRAAAGSDATRALAAGAERRLAREAHLAEEAALRGLPVPPGVATDAKAHLARAERWVPADPETRLLARELRRLALFRGALALLARSQDPKSAARAASQLSEAERLFPERAEAALYLAVALERAGDLPGAEAALARARDACPRILETRAGRRAVHSLGFPRSAELRRGLAAAGARAP